MNAVQPKKLLLSKWTAVQPSAREKHFIIIALEAPEPPEAPLHWVQIEAVHSKRSQRIAWRALKDDTVWHRGWV